jgi:hypothetical protein
MKPRLKEGGAGPNAAGVRKCCGMPDCTDPVLARGLCMRHYQRWRRYGDPAFVTPKPEACCPHCAKPIPRNEAGRLQVKWIKPKA